MGSEQIDRDIAQLLQEVLQRVVTHSRLHPDKSLVTCRNCSEPQIKNTSGRLNLCILCGAGGVGRRESGMDWSAQVHLPLAGGTETICIGCGDSIPSLFWRAVNQDARMGICPLCDGG